MAIPKIIHYCWFGKNEMPKAALKCIKSWHKKCPDYKIVEYNEGNFDISACPLYVRQAYELKKWAFVTDYVRLKVVFDNGGIYLDTDVELRKSLDPLLCCSAYFGFQSDGQINTGHGFGAVKHAAIIEEMMRQYDNIAFVRADRTCDLTPCPERNTEVFFNHGILQNNSKQILDGNVLILPTEYLCPIDYRTAKKKITRNTYSIHWFYASWHPDEPNGKHVSFLKKQRRKYIRRKFGGVLIKLLGQKKFDSLIAKLLR